MFHMTECAYGEGFTAAQENVDFETAWEAYKNGGFDDEPAASNEEKKAFKAGYKEGEKLT